MWQWLKTIKQIKYWILSHMFKLFLFLLLIPALIYSKNILSYLNTQLTQMKLKNKKTKPLKIVVFDLDETLGYFTEISMFWDALEHFYGHNLFADKFYEMLDVFPEVFRPNMIPILDVLYKKKMRKTCYKLFIYTNNQGPKSWVTMLSDYINLKTGHKIFDSIIAAYKVRGKQIEPKRTSHDKSVTDLISCTDIPANTEICFIDDLYHPLMDKDNVYYINIKPYRISLPFEEMASRYYDAVLDKIMPISKNTFINKIVPFMKQYNYMVLNKSEEEKNVDRIVSKKLLANLEEFLKNDKPPNTRKVRQRRVKSMRFNYNV
jgi:hypothetical protein